MALGDGRGRRGTKLAGERRLTARLGRVRDMRAGGKADREDWLREGLLVPTGLAAGRMRNQSRNDTREEDILSEGDGSGDGKCRALIREDAKV
jgi:hypothetical protein